MKGCHFKEKGGFIGCTKKKDEEKLRRCENGDKDEKKVWNIPKYGSLFHSPFSVQFSHLFFSQQS